MAKTSVSFVCQECGGTHRKWSGRCDHCGAWNTIAEEREEAVAGRVGLNGEVERQR